MTERHRPTLKRLLVPIDFSEPSARAIELAQAVARGMGGRITLLHVGVVPHFYATELGMAGPVTPLLEEMSIAVTAEQTAKLKELQGTLDADLIEAVELSEGFPPEEILHRAHEGGFDLVVMGTHGRTGLRRALLGSVTERVVRDCRIPVMVTH